MRLILTMEELSPSMFSLPDCVYALYDGYAGIAIILYIIVCHFIVFSSFPVESKGIRNEDFCPRRGYVSVDSSTHFFF